MADIVNSDLVGIMRAMAWERAKGELFSMTQSYIRDPEKLDGFIKLMNEFVLAVEGDGLHW